MLNYPEALDLILRHARPLRPRSLPLAEALGRVVARDLVSPEPFPRFDNSAVDGYAVRFGRRRPNSVAKAFKVRGEIPAGQVYPAPLQRCGVYRQTLRAGEAVRIFTGAPVPQGAEAVVMQEYTERRNGEVLLLKQPGPLENIRFQGEDFHRGRVLVRKQTILSPAHLALLAAVGFIKAPVYPAPRVAFFSTGNELLKKGERPGPGKIRDSNSILLESLLRSHGAQALPLPPVGDRPARLPFELADFEAGADVPAAALSSEDMDALAAAARGHGVLLVLSVGDDDGLRLAVSVRPTAVHVPAAALVDLPFLATAAPGRSLWLDTAMAGLDEVAEAVAAALKAGGRPSLLHGLVTAAARPEEVNLQALSTLRERFGVPVGWEARDATPAIALAAVALGATLLVVPFAADGRGGFDAAGLRALKTDARLVARALGDGDKRVQPSEWAERDRVHRSLIARVDIARGRTLTAEMLATARPGIGLKPRALEAVVGRRAALDIPAGTLITLGMLE